MRDWVPRDDMVHFVINAVEALDLRGAEVNERGQWQRAIPTHDDADADDLLLRERDLQ